jgi:hypothetical protein
MIVLPAVDFGTVSSSITSAQTLPLSTPNLYFSGLTFTEPNPDYRGAFFGNPYIRQNDSTWSSSTGGLLVFYAYAGTWNLYVGCEFNDPENGWINSNEVVAIKSSDGTSIPLKGWILLQSPFIVAGTLVVKTTP